jgi:hypothetical protein
VRERQGETDEERERKRENFRSAVMKYLNDKRFLLSELNYFWHCEKK